MISPEFRNKEFKAYIYPLKGGNYKYIEKVVIQGTIYVWGKLPDDHVDEGGIFYFMLNMKTIEGLENFDMSHASSLNRLFDGCWKLESIKGAEKWDVSNVTDMNNMFYDCNNLTSLEPVAKWNVSNVTDMHHTFLNCKKNYILGSFKKLECGKCY